MPSLRHAAASLQTEGQGLMLLETNKAWGACGELVSRKHLCSKTDLSLHLPLSEGMNAKNAGYFRKTTARLPPLGHIAWVISSIKWLMESQIFLCQLLSNGGRSIWWHPRGNDLKPDYSFSSGMTQLQEQVEQDGPLLIQLQPGDMTQESASTGGFHTCHLYTKQKPNQCVFTSPSSESPPLPDVSHNVQSHQRLRSYACKWR